jgi:hypothetical protein
MKRMRVHPPTPVTEGRFVGHLHEFVGMSDDETLPAFEFDTRKPITCVDCVAEAKILRPKFYLEACARWGTTPDPKFLESIS